jgi:hypothetical protein
VTNYFILQGNSQTKGDFITVQRVLLRVPVGCFPSFGFISKKSLDITVYVVGCCSGVGYGDEYINL